MSRGASPLLVGRDSEFVRLRDAIATIGSNAKALVLVSGEAGIGKSRLLAELESSVVTDPPGGRPVTFLRATCIEVGERLAFLPILDWLDALRATATDISAEANELHAAFGGFDPSDESGASRSARFARLRDLLVTAAAAGPVVAVIDDLHWADRSTLDVISFLARRLERTDVLLIAAYRSDELHRRHPLVGPLAELERHATQDHVRLEPLDTSDVARQIGAIEGRSLDPGREARIVELADGNPFHVEELIALDRPGPLPSTLREVLASRLAQIDDATLGVLREAAVIGRRVDAELLATIARADRDAVDRALRAALDARILVRDEDGRRVRFRHALLREAVYDEVLPSDRIDLHRRIAIGLAERPDLGDPSPATASAELARHWLAARADREAFGALLAAAQTSASAVAWAEARWAMEEALGLWDRLPDAAELAAMPRSRLFDRAATYAWYQGDSRRALELNHRAQAEPDVAADPDRLGLLLVRETWYQSDLGESAAAWRAVQHAVDLIPADPPSRHRALAVGTLGISIGATGRLLESIAMLEASARMATELDDRVGAAGSLTFLAAQYATFGRESDAFAATSKARVVVGSARTGQGVDDAWFAFSSNVPFVALELGQERMTIEEVEFLFDESRQRGVEASLGAWLMAPLVIAQFRLGRWGDALTSIDAATSYDASIGPHSHMQAVHAMIAAGRGAIDEGRRIAAMAIAVGRAGWLDEALIVRAAAAWIELLAGDSRAAAAPIEDAIGLLPADEPTTWRAELAWLAAWAAADATTRRRQPDADRMERLAAFARRVADDPGQADDVATRAGRLSGFDRWRRLAAAELDRRDGRDDPDTWSNLAAELEAIDNVPYAGLARLREGAARLARGDDRDRVRDALSAALAHADQMGATVIRDRVNELARAGRVGLGRPSEAVATTAEATMRDDVPAADGPDRWGLSPREREVLALLAGGKTNAEIGAALFISAKTASVHVTHILAKLEVSTRVEAALLAVSAGHIGSGNVASLETGQAAHDGDR